jgi:hypothetical protein
VIASKDISDEHVIDLARRWHQDSGSAPCVLDALVAEGFPEKVAEHKIMRLVRRGLLEYGVSPRCAWPTS